MLKNSKRFACIFLSSVLISTFVGCKSNTSSSSGSESVSAEVAGATESAIAQGTSNESDINLDFSDFDITTDYVSDDASYIKLNTNFISVDGNGNVSGNTVTINSAGTYVVSGTLNDGQIIIDAADLKIQLVLNGVTMACSNSAPIYIKSADKVVITLADGTTNTISDTANYVFKDAETKEPNAAIFSNDDLTFNGTGALTVKGNYNNGIDCNDDLKIVEGTIAVTAVNNGIKGNDSVSMKSGDVTVTSGGDGIKSTNETDTSKGYVYIESGTVKITSGEDSIQAYTNLLIYGGTISTTSGGGSSNSSDKSTWGKTTTEEASTKGLKSTNNISISGGTLNIDSSDDSIHTSDTVKISGGTLTLSSGDDGIHADSGLQIDNGTITIVKSYEGLESASIIINDGTTYVTASDDGLNAAGGADSSATNGRPGQNTFNTSGGQTININGGYLCLNAVGDGIDSNGNMTFSGGTIVVNGPTDDGNCPLDSNGTISTNGGTVIASGSSGMLETPSTSSSQYCVVLALSSSISAGTIVRIEDSDGNEILTFAPAKTSESIVFSSSAIKKGSEYTIYTGGSCTGKVKDGVYSAGTYSGGTEYDTFEVSSIITSVGNTTGGFGGGGGGGNNFH